MIGMRCSLSVFVLHLTSIPPRRETEPCSLSGQITRIGSDGSTQLASLQEEIMKACQAHEPHTAPTFMLPGCGILTGISWHAFVSTILLKKISSLRNNSHFTTLF